MKIISIEFENLNSLAGHWKIDFAAADFAASGIFAIIGKTGAGKTTILDAVCLALFGRTPRVKVSGAENEVMSKNRGGCMAEIVFENNGKVYLSRFEQRRARNRSDGALQSVQRSVQELGNPATLVTMIRDVEAKVTEYLGMDYEQFMRSVMLAQGQFNTFLTAEAADKSKILEKITGTARYEKISQKTFEIAKRFREDYERLKQEAEALTLLSEEDEQALANEQAEKEKTAAVLLLQQQEARLKLQNQHERELTAAALRQKQILLEEQKRKTALFEPNRQRLEQAQKAEPLAADYNSWKEKGQKLTAVAARSAAAHLGLEKKQREVKERRLAVSAAEQVWNDFVLRKKTWEEQIAEARRLDDGYKVLEQTLQVYAKALTDADNAVRISEKELILLQAENERSRQRFVQAQNYLEKHPKDGDLEFLQLELTPLLQELSEIRTKLPPAEKAAAEKKQQLRHENMMCERMQKEKETCEHDLNSAKAEVAALQTQIAQLLEGKQPADYRRLKEELSAEYKSREKMRDYRQNLTEGKPCPLCGAVHHPLIAAREEENEKQLGVQISALEQKITALERLEGEIKVRQTAVESLTERKNAAVAESIRQEELLKRLTAEAALTAQNTSTLAERQAVLQKMQTEIYSRYGADENLRPEEVRARFELYRKHKNDCESLKTIVEVAKNELANRQRHLVELQKRREEAAAAASSQQKLCDDNRLQRAEKFGQWDCDEKVRQLEGEEKACRLQKEQSDRLAAETEKEEARLAAVYQAECAHIDELEREKCRLEEKLTPKAADYGVDGIEQLQSLFMDVEEKERLQKQQTDLQQETMRLTLQIEEDRRRLQRLQQQYPATDLSKLQAEEERISAAVNELNRQIGAIKQKLDDNRMRRDSLREKLGRLQTLKRQSEDWERLNELIGSSSGKKFREFAQGIAFDVLIGFANRQLAQMSDRYVLVRATDLGLDVIDHYQGGERRAVKNLSGGESFMVSLALALGLSKMSSRRIRIDSLFLDEGFGTLDEEALNTTLDALSRLERENKLIGIISHVAALKESIPTRIEVVKVSGGNSRLSGAGCSQADGT